MEISLPDVNPCLLQRASDNGQDLTQKILLSIKYSLANSNSLLNKVQFELSNIFLISYFSKFDLNDPTQIGCNFTIDKPIRNEENLKLIIDLFYQWRKINFDGICLDKIYDFHYDFANFLITLESRSNINQIIINFLETRNIEEEMTHLKHLLDLLYLKYKFNVDDNSEITYLANKLSQKEHPLYKDKMFINWALDNLDVLKHLFSKLQAKLLNHDPFLNIIIEVWDREIENSGQGSYNLITLNNIIDLFEYVNFSVCTPKSLSYFNTYHNYLSSYYPPNFQCLSRIINFRIKNTHEYKLKETDKEVVFNNKTTITNENNKETVQYNMSFYKTVTKKVFKIKEYSLISSKEHDKNTKLSWIMEGFNYHSGKWEQIDSRKDEVFNKSETKYFRLDVSKTISKLRIVQSGRNSICKNLKTESIKLIGHYTKQFDFSQMFPLLYLLTILAIILIVFNSIINTCMMFIDKSNQTIPSQNTSEIMETWEYQPNNDFMQDLLNVTKYIPFNNSQAEINYHSTLDKMFEFNEIYPNSDQITS